MKITLINPNRYRFPPVIPIGLEYLATILENNNHDVKILDLCFSNDIYSDINSHFREYDPDLIGVTIRNVDPSIYGKDEYFIEEIKDIVLYIKDKYDKTIILGGSGFSVMPEEILEYVGGDYGIIGYGENAILKLLNNIKQSSASYKIIDGFKLGIDKNLFHIRGKHFNYKRYFDEGSIAGFETQKGCSGDCIFCSEANRRIIHKNIKNVLNEIKIIADMGYKKFHLCDSEFNLNLEFSEKLLKSLIKENIDIKWVLYMKPVPYNKQYFRLLKDSGAEVITLSVDSYRCEDTKSPYSYEDLKNIIKYCREYGIKLAVDLLVGFPYEAKNSINNVIQFFKNNRPNTVGISYAIRIYPYTEIEKIISKDSNLKNKLSGYLNDNFIKPVYFKELSLDDINKFVDNDELFKIEGFQETVNYQRL